MTLLFQGRAVLISSKIPCTRHFYPVSPPHKGPIAFPHIDLIEPWNTEGCTHPHTPPHHSCAFPQPPKSPAGKDIRSRGRTAGSSRRQSSQSQPPSSRRSSSGSVWDMAAAALPSGRGSGGKGAPRSHKPPRPRKRKRLHVGAAEDGPAGSRGWVRARGRENGVGNAPGAPHPARAGAGKGQRGRPARWVCAH